MTTILTVSDQVQELKNLKAKLPLNSQKFADSLITQFEQKAFLSPSQFPYVAKLIAMAKADPSKRESEDVGDYSQVIAMFESAKVHIKYPKLHFVAGEYEIRMAMTGKMSKYPGQVNVTSPGGFGEATWYGRVSADGKWVKSPNMPEGLHEPLASLLIDLGLDPSGTVSKNGKMANRCCFCHKELTDPKSVKAGFGEVCSQHYGLHDQWKGLAC